VRDGFRGALLTAPRACIDVTSQRMIRKSGHRFSEKIMRSKRL